MRYMMFIKHAEDFDMKDVPQSLFGAMDQFIQDATKAGVFVDGGGFEPTKAATRIRLSKGKITTTDGPFAEAKEVIGGYSIMECKTRDEALDYARKFMELHRDHWPTFQGECEVRPYQANP